MDTLNLVQGSTNGGDDAKAEGASKMSKVRELLIQSFTSAKEGDLAKLRSALKECAKVDGPGTSIEHVINQLRDGRGRTVLHFACSEKQTAIVEYLLKKAPNAASLTDDDGMTPLHIAASSEALSVAKLLVNAGASLSAKSKSGALPLHYAAGGKSIELVDYIAEQMSKEDLAASSDSGNALQWSVGGGDIDMSRHLLQLGISPNSSDSSGVTPLIYSVVSGKLDVVKVLLDHGADIRKTLTGGLNAVHIAAEMGSIEILNCLLQAPESEVQEAVNAESEDKSLPLQLAAREGHKGAVDMLLPRTLVMKSKTSDEVIGQEASKKAEPIDTQNNSDTGLAGQSVVDNLRQCTAEEEAQALAEKSVANGLFVKGNYQDALLSYNKAVELNPRDPFLYSNRSACYLKLEKPKEALADIHVCKALKPNWSKAFYREGQAFEALKDYENAAYAYWDGWKLDQSNSTLEKLFHKAIENARKNVSTTSQ